MNYVVTFKKLNGDSQLVDSRRVLCESHFQHFKSSRSTVTMDTMTHDACDECTAAWYLELNRKSAKQTWLKELCPNDIIYLSGPMSGIEARNKPAFYMMEHIVKQFGVQVLSPAHHPPDMPYEWYMRRDITFVCQANIMIMLKGWRSSPGAMVEWTVGRVIGVKIYEER